jgi:hypothetical protein
MSKLRDLVPLWLKKTYWSGLNNRTIEREALNP